MPKNSRKERKNLCLTKPKLSISSSHFFLDETSEGMFLLYLLELAETAHLKVYGNYPEALFHVKDFRRSMVEVLQIYVCIMRK